MSHTYDPSVSRWAQWRLAEGLCLGGGLLALAVISWGVADQAGPLFVAIVMVGLVGGAIVLLRPQVGVFIMFAMILFKPDAIQGLGVLGPNTLIAVGLSGLLFLTVVLGGPADFLNSNQIKAFMLLSAITAVNWYWVGRIDPPAYLADRDFTNRSLYRFAIQFALLTFVVAYLRTRLQLLTLNALYVGAVLITAALALAGVGLEGTGGGGGTGAKHLARMLAANPTKVEALRTAAAAGIQSAENANRLAFLSLTAISITWFALLHYRSLLLKLAGGATILGLVLVVFKSGSRSGVLQLALLAVLLLAQSRLNPGRIASFILLAFVAVGLIVAFVPDIVMDRLASMVVTQEYQEKSLVESNVRRLTVLGAGLKLIADSPIMGTGIGNFRWMTALDIEHGGLAMAAHNAYLLALAEGGIVLLAGYLVLFWFTARDLSRTLKAAARLPGVGLEWLVRATRANLALLLTFAIFAEAWKEIFFVLILATAAALTQIYRRAALSKGASA